MPRPDRCGYSVQNQPFSASQESVGKESRARFRAQASRASVTFRTERARSLLPGAPLNRTKQTHGDRKTSSSYPWQGKACLKVRATGPARGRLRGRDLPCEPASHEDPRLPLGERDDLDRCWPVVIGHHLVVDRGPVPGGRRIAELVLPSRREAGRARLSRPIRARAREADDGGKDEDRGRLAARAGLDLGNDIAGEALRCPAPSAERVDCRVTPSSGAAPLAGPPA